MAFCTHCGKENAEGLKFCPACGSAMEAAPPPAAAAPAAPAYQQPQPYQQQAYQQPYQQPQPYQQQAYQQPYQQAQPYPQQYYQPVAARRSSGSSRMVGGVIVLIAAALIIVGTFTPWFKYDGDFSSYSASASGWDTREMIDNQVFDWGNGKPLFSGLSSLIAGILLALAAVLVIATRSRGLAGLAFFFSILALIMAGTNAYSILSAEIGISMGFGMILFLAGSVGALAGSIVSMSG